MLSPDLILTVTGAVCDLSLLFKDSFGVNLSWIPDDDDDNDDYVTGCEAADAASRDAIPQITFLRLLGMFTCQKKPISFVMLIYLSAYISVAPTGWISMKFDTGDLYECLSRNSICG